jgi:hypothetical protein
MTEYIVKDYGAKVRARRMYRHRENVPAIVAYLEKISLEKPFFPGSKFKGYVIGRARYLEVITGLKQFYVVGCKMPASSAYKQFKKEFVIDRTMPDIIMVRRDIPIPIGNSALSLISSGPESCQDQFSHTQII